MSGDQLSLLAARPPRHRASTATARLLTLNNQHASPARSRLQAAWIADQETADLVVITEVGPGPGGTALTQALTDHGYTSLIDPQPTGSDYRTVLASRAADLAPLPLLTTMPHRAPAATLTIAHTTITLLGLYVPSRGPRQHRNQAKRAFQTAVTHALPDLATHHDGPVIVLGDLNVVEPGHTPHHPVFGTWEYDFYRSFTDAGLTDAFRTLHPDTIDHSWFGRSDRGYRFDHAFITARHAPLLTACTYLHAPRQQQLTDHAALTLTLNLPPI